VTGKSFKVAESFLFDGIGLIFVVENLFEFELFAEEQAGSFVVVEGEGAFVDYFGRVGRFAAALGADFESECKAVNGFVGMVHEISDVCS